MQHHLVKQTTLLAMLITTIFASIYGFGKFFQTDEAHAGGGEATVSFDSNVYTVNEGAGSVEVSVRIQRTHMSTVTVDYLTVDGTATVGNDYEQRTGTVTFVPDDNSNQTFTIPINEDTVYEGSTPEEFSVVLVNTTGPTVTLGSPNVAEIRITENDDAPESTPTPDDTIFVDVAEPNDTLAEAYTTSAGASAISNLTLWPVGDVDYFRFAGKAGSAYRIFTDNLSSGLDTVLTVYDTQGRELGTNDDASDNVGVRRSELLITADVDGFYFARIINQDPTDPTDRTYSFRVVETSTPTPSPTATAATRIPSDFCEYNGTTETACLILPNETNTNLSFVPFIDEPQDTDFFRLPVKAGLEYVCETTNLSILNDTNIILLDQNGNDFNPPIGNNNKETDETVIDFGSLVRYVATYDGWIYVVVGPVFVPPYEESGLYTYNLTCTQGIPSTATPTPTFTPSPIPPPVSTPSGGGTVATNTPVPPTVEATSPPIIPTITFPPTPTPIDFSTLLPPPSPTPPVIQFEPLPTATPLAAGGQEVTVNVTLYYDSNGSFTPELTEGIEGVAVALYDNGTGALISFGLTNEAGMLRFPAVSSSGAVRVVVPFFNYNQVVVGGSENVLLRVAPQSLPVNIP